MIKLPKSRKAESNKMIYEEKLEEKKENQEYLLEKKERLIQTYIVMYGLLLACTQNLDKVTQVISLCILIRFLICAITYYTAITIKDDKIKISFIRLVPRIEAIKSSAEATSKNFGLAITIYLSKAIFSLFDVHNVPRLSSWVVVILYLTFFIPTKLMHIIREAFTMIEVLRKKFTKTEVLKKVFTIIEVPRKTFIKIKVLRKEHVALFSLIFFCTYCALAILIQTFLQIPLFFFFINIALALSGIFLADTMAKSLKIN